MRISILLEALTGTFETDVDRSSKRFQREMRKMEREARRIGRRIGLAMAAAATGFVELIRRTTNSTDEMIKFGHRLGLTAEEMRRLQFVADRTGTNINSFANAMQRLTRNLADARDGAGPAAGALERLGLSASELLDMGQDQAFFRIGEALKNVEDRGLQAQLAFQLLGREGQALLGMINRSGDQFAEMANEFDRFALSLSNLQADNIERLSDAMSDVATVTQLARQRFVAELAPAVEIIIDRFVLARASAGDLGDAVNDAAQRGARAIAFAMNAVDGLVRTFKIAGRAIALQFAFLERGAWTFANALINGPTRSLNFLIEQANRVPGIELPEIRLPGAERIEQRLELLKGIIREGAADIQDILLAPLAGDTMLDEFAKRADRELARAASSVAQAMTEIATETESAASAADKMIQALEQQVATLGFTDAAVQLYRLQIEGATDAQLRHAEALLESIDSHEALQGAMREAEQVFQSTRTPLERFNAEIERLNMLRDTFVDGRPLIDGETYRRAVEAAQDALDQATQNASQWETMVDEIARSAARNIQSALADFLFDPFDRGLSGMLRSFADTLRRMAAEVMAQQILQSFFSASGGLGGVLGGFLGGGVTRDSGGRGIAGQPVMIGTGAQPEMFIPDTAGTFVPARQMAGSQIINNVTVQAPQGRISRESDLQLRTSLASATNEGLRRGS